LRTRAWRAFILLASAERERERDTIGFGDLVSVRHIQACEQDKSKDDPEEKQRLLDCHLYALNLRSQLYVKLHSSTLGIYRLHYRGTLFIEEEAAETQHVELLHVHIPPDN
jgi:hypothetical protein